MLQIWPVVSQHSPPRKYSASLTSFFATQPFLQIFCKFDQVFSQHSHPRKYSASLTSFFSQHSLPRKYSASLTACCCWWRVEPGTWGPPVNRLFSFLPGTVDNYSNVQQTNIKFKVGGFSQWVGAATLPVVPCLLWVAPRSVICSTFFESYIFDTVS